MRGLLTRPAWVVAHCLVAFAVVIILRVVKDLLPRSVEDIGWTVVSAALLSVLTGAGGMIPGVFFRRRPRIVFICGTLSMVLLLLLSILLIIQA